MRRTYLNYIQEFVMNTKMSNHTHLQDITAISSYIDSFADTEHTKEYNWLVRLPPLLMMLYLALYRLIHMVSYMSRPRSAPQKK